MAAGGGGGLAVRAGLAFPAAARALIQRFDRVTSTQDVARELAAGGASLGTVVVALEQTGGRGRLGSSFFSPPGGLYLSVLLGEVSPLMSLAAGVAVARTVRDYGLEPLLKWPNDVLVGGRKICGILAEAALGRTILGIGLNVNISQFPDDLRTKATSMLVEGGRGLDVDMVLQTLLGHLEVDEPVVAAWKGMPNMLGLPVRVLSGSQQVRGVALDLDSDGALVVAVDGDVRRFVSGEVHLEVG